MSKRGHCPAAGLAQAPDWRDVDWCRHRRWVTVDGRRANVVELGTGPALVFVHGLSGSWQNWLENLVPFARDHRVIAVDLPGFGQSETPEDGVSIAGWARWLDRLCDVLEIEAATFVGNSMGGFICAELAISFPRRVERLVLVTAAGLTVEHQRDERLLRLIEATENVLQVLLARTLASSEALARRPRGRRALMWAVAAHPERLSAPLVLEQLHGVGTPGFVPALDALTSYPIRERLSKILCPTLIVWGEKDRLVPLRDAYEFQRLIADSRLIVYEDTGHVPMLERPERFNRDLRTFLGEDLSVTGGPGGAGNGATQMAPTRPTSAEAASIAVPDHEVVVIGAGFSGIGAAIALDRAGIPDYVVLEAGDGVGGAWHWNTYPGVAVDIPSFSYQFSFEQRSDWSRVYAPGTELKAYAEHCVDKYGLRSRIRLNTEVVAATFDDETHLWRLETAVGGAFSARFVIGATGVLTKPKPPDIPGLDEFEGTVMHTARWDHREDLGGRRVAIIGTGASAVQVIPSIAPLVDRLVVFQRTPIWCLPKPDAPLGRKARSLLTWLPGGRRLTRLASQVFVEFTFPLPAHFDGVVPLARGAERLGRRYLRDQVLDPELRDKLAPRYSLGCKRPSFSNDYLATFNRDNVELETTAIEEITAGGLRTVDGTEHAADVIILATGFKVFESGNMPPFAVRGAEGVDLEQWWDTNRFQAYEGVSVPGFPNYFSILGPYGYNGSSYFQLIETQMRHVVRCLKRAREDGATRVEVTAEANDRYFKSMLARRHNQVFFQGSCANANSYYFDRHGDVPFRASPSLEAMWRSARFDLDDYRFDATRAAGVA